MDTIEYGARVCTVVLEKLSDLETLIGMPWTHVAETQIINTCLDAMKACSDVGLCRSDLPRDSSELSGFAPLGTGFFNADLWDHVLHHMEQASGSEDARVEEGILEAASTVAATIRFLLKSKKDRKTLLAGLEESLRNKEFLAERSCALAAANKKEHDTVADPNVRNFDVKILNALYTIVFKHLGPAILTPLGFPCSVLGLHSLFAGARAGGHGNYTTAAVCNVWHAGHEAGPLLFAPHIGSTEPTLVIAFSSLGWKQVIHPEWGTTLQQATGENIIVAHAMDLAQSWYCTNPSTGEYDNGAWWENRIAQLCQDYAQVCLLGDSMGGTAALRFASFATRSVFAVVPQVDVTGFNLCSRTDFVADHKASLREAVLQNCRETRAHVTVHVGAHPYDVRQVSLLPVRENIKVIRHKTKSHLVSATLKRQGNLVETVLSGLFGPGMSSALPEGLI